MVSAKKHVPIVKKRTLILPQTPQHQISELAECARWRAMEEEAATWLSLVAQNYSRRRRYAARCLFLLSNSNDHQSGISSMATPYANPRQCQYHRFYYNSTLIVERVIVKMGISACINSATTCYGQQL